MTSLSENTTASEPRSRRVGIAGPPEDFRLSTTSTASTSSSLFSPPSPSTTSPPIPPRSPLRPTAKAAPGSPPPTLPLIATLADELGTDDMSLLSSRSMGSLSDLLDKPASATARRPHTPDKPLPLTPQPSNSMPLSILDPEEDDETLVPSASARSSLTAVTSKRTHALLELLSSERAYASDLALIRDIHIPLALGQPAPFAQTPATPPGSSGSSSRTLSTVSDSSAASSSSACGPAMTVDDVKIIFMNVEDLASFADVFTEALEDALGEVLDGGSGEDTVGKLFLETIPRLEPLYRTYITKHPTALEHLSNLPQTPALTAYLAQTRTLASSLSHAWDLPSLLIKPVQRLLKGRLAASGRGALRRRRRGAVPHLGARSVDGRRNKECLGVFRGAQLARGGERRFAGGSRAAVDSRFSPFAQNHTRTLGTRRRLHTDTTDTTQVSRRRCVARVRDGTAADSALNTSRGVCSTRRRPRPRSVVTARRQRVAVKAVETPCPGFKTPPTSLCTSGRERRVASSLGVARSTFTISATHLLARPRRLHAKRLVAVAVLFSFMPSALVRVGASSRHLPCARLPGATSRRLPRESLPPPPLNTQEAVLTARPLWEALRAYLSRDTHDVTCTSPARRREPRCASYACGRPQDGSRKRTRKRTSSRRTTSPKRQPPSPTARHRTSRTRTTPSEGSSSTPLASTAGRLRLNTKDAAVGFLWPDSPLASRCPRRAP